jgi:hypothetical protein
LFIFTIDQNQQRSHVLNMFNTRRMFLWLLGPAVVMLLAALARSPLSLWAVAAAPPLAALPFVGIAAAVEPDSRLHGFSVRAIQGIGWLGIPWSILLALFAGPYGVLTGLVTLPLLRPVTTERRRAALAVWLGVVGAVAMLPLAWLGVRFELFGAGAVLLVAGGVMWMLAAREGHASTGATLPRAIVR